MHPEKIRAEAEALLRRQDLTAALQRFDDLVRHEPTEPQNWSGYGKALIAARRTSDAIRAMERASALAPRDIAVRSDLGGMAQLCCRLDEALHWHGEALALAPDSLVLRLNHAFVWPVVADSAAQIQSCRERCRVEFDQLLRDPAIRLYPDHNATNHTFGLAYHGIDDRIWLEEYAQLVCRLGAGMEGPRLSATAVANRSSGARLRLGFLSVFFYRHSNSLAFEGLLRGLDRERFELVLIHLDGSRDDEVRRRLEAGVDRVVHCPIDPSLAWQRLQDLQLDLLFITDVGMNPVLPMLLTRRCAPVQVTGWGFPRTSGFPTIDYYLSGDLVEPAHGQEHYSETLVRLSGLPCRFLSDNLAIAPEAAQMGREYFLLPRELPLVGCLQTTWKLHPDFDAVLERIARAVPDCLFVFLAPRYPELGEPLLRRLQRAAPLAAERLVLLAEPARPEYRVLAGSLDVLLDTPHFGSGISFYDAISTGTPIVTMEGPFLRSRFVAGGYRLMQLEDPPIAADPAAMADLTIALLRDPARLRSLRQRIGEAAHSHLFDRMDMVHSFEAFATEAIERSRQQPPIP